MKKAEPRLRKRVETIVSESPGFRVTVKCEQSRLHIPHQIAPGPIRDYVEGVAPYLGQEPHESERVEAKFRVKIETWDERADLPTADANVQHLELTLPQLARVMLVVGKIMPEEMPYGALIRGPRGLAVPPGGDDDLDSVPDKGEGEGCDN